jgi:hypothetical protein
MFRLWFIGFEAHLLNVSRVSSRVSSTGGAGKTCSNNAASIII